MYCTEEQLKSLKDYYGQINGCTIEDIEVDEEGFLGLYLVGEEFGNRWVWLSCDDEGNGPGSLLNMPQQD